MRDRADAAADTENVLDCDERTKLGTSERAEVASTARYCRCCCYERRRSTAAAAAVGEGGGGGDDFRLEVIWQQAEASRPSDHRRALKRSVS